MYSCNLIILAFFQSECEKLRVSSVNQNVILRNHFGISSFESPMIKYVLSIISSSHAYLSSGDRIQSRIQTHLPPSSNIRLFAYISIFSIFIDLASNHAIMTSVMPELTIVI